MGVLESSKNTSSIDIAEAWLPKKLRNRSGGICWIFSAPDEVVKRNLQHEIFHVLFSLSENGLKMAWASPSWAEFWEPLDKQNSSEIMLTSRGAVCPKNVGVNCELQPSHFCRFVGLHRRVLWLEAGVEENLGAPMAHPKILGLGFLYPEDIGSQGLEQGETCWPLNWDGEIL